MRRLALVLIATVACGEPSDPGPELPSEPAEIRVAPTDGAHLCGGMQAWVDAEIERVIDRTGLEPRFDLPVELGRAAVDEHCVDGTEPAEILGCAQGDEGATAVYAAPAVLAHELVHGLRRQQELRTVSFFEEGFAEALDGSDAYPRWTELEPEAEPEVWQPEVLVEVDRLDRGQTYRVASHFVGFLEAEYGEDEVAAFMRGGIDTSGDAAMQRFEAHFGRSLAEAAEAWRDAGQQGFGRGNACPDGVEPAPSGEVALEVTIDCDAPTTMGMLGAGESAWVRRCLELPAGPMVVAIDGGTVRFESVPGTCAEDSEVLDAAPKELGAGEELTVDFAACSWAVTFESTEDGLVSAALSPSTE